MNKESIKECIINDTKKLIDDILMPIDFDTDDFYERLANSIDNVIDMFIELEEARYDKHNIGNIAEIVISYLCDYYKVDKEEMHHD